MANRRQPKLNENGKHPDRQKSKVYAFEREAPTMAGGDNCATGDFLHWVPAEDLDDNLVRLAQDSTLQPSGRELVQVPAFDKWGNRRRYYREDNPMPWFAVEELVGRICADYIVPTVPLYDGRGRKNAGLRWRSQYDYPNDPRLRHANNGLFAVNLALPRFSRNCWSLCHETAHYLTYCYFPASTASHGPVFVGLFLDLLEAYGPPGWDRPAAEADARLRGVKFDPHTDRQIIRGRHQVKMSLAETNRRRQAAVEEHYRRRDAEREAYRRDYYGLD